MREVPGLEEKRIRLRYAGGCRLCGVSLQVGAEAVYEKSTRTVRCVECAAARSDPADSEVLLLGDAVTEVESGVPGGSARRELERRRAMRVERVRSQHPRLGGVILALTDDPQSTKAWGTGATGEERLGAQLNGYASEFLRVLHDRRIPGSRANIDHLVVAKSGIYVVDAKRYKGRPSLKVEGGLLRPRVERLLVGRRDCTEIVDGVLKQVKVVRDVVGDRAAVHGVLCFIGADWPLVGGSFTTRGVDVLWPKKLYPKLASDGPLSVEGVAQIHRIIAAALPRT